MDSGAGAGGVAVVVVETGGVVVVMTKTTSNSWRLSQWRSWRLVVGTGNRGDERFILLWVVGTVGARSAPVSVRIHAGIKLIGDVGVVWAVIGGIVIVSKTTSSRTDSVVRSLRAMSGMGALAETKATWAGSEGSCGGVVSTMGTVGSSDGIMAKGTTSVSIRIDTGVQLVGSIGIMWASVSGGVTTEAACGGVVSAGQVATVMVVVSARVQNWDVIVVVVERPWHGLTVRLTKSSSASISVGINTRVELVGSIGVVWAGVGRTDSTSSGVIVRGAVVSTESSPTETESTKGSSTKGG
jgi:hypothetical protein